MIRLENTRGSSYKFYELHLIKTKNRITVLAQYGAIGKATKEFIVYEGANLEKAEKAFEVKRQEKLKKGYVEIRAGGGADVEILPDPETEGVEHDDGQQQWEEEEEERRRQEEKQKKRSARK